MKGGLGKRVRRQSALALLEEDLKRGTKPEKIKGRTSATMIPLSEKDISRIEAEISILTTGK